MTDREFDDAKELWKLTYAHNSIEQVGNTIVFILKNNIRRNHRLFNPLITAIYTTYGRPFSNNRPVGKLDLELFSDAQTAFHKRLIQLRDQFFAHTDVGANKSKAHGPLLQVAYTFRANQAPAEFTNAIQPQRGHLRLLLSYLNSIRPIIDGRRSLKWHRLAAHRPMANGEFILNVYDKTKHLWLTKEEAKRLSIPNATELHVVDPPKRRPIKQRK